MLASAASTTARLCRVACQRRRRRLCNCIIHYRFSFLRSFRNVFFGFWRGLLIFYGRRLNFRLSGLLSGLFGHICRFDGLRRACDKLRTKLPAALLEDIALE